MKCLNCGFDAEAGLNKKQISGMSNYVNKASGIRAVYQRDEKEFNTGEGDLTQTWIRADVFDKQPRVTQPILTQKPTEPVKDTEPTKLVEPVKQTANPA
jgi:hypothetical protein